MGNNQNQLSRREFVKMGAISTAGLAMGGVTGCSKSGHTLPALTPLSNRPKADPSKQPNIIFLFSDQHRYDALGCHGNSVIQTPHLDQLAAKGLYMSNTHCASPVCQPSRASILTGLYPHQTGVLANLREEIDPKLPTMPRQLQKAGYKTAIIGKTHYWNLKLSNVNFSVMKWGVDARQKEDYIRAFGFDDVIEEFDLSVHSFDKFNINIDTPYTEYLRKRGKLESYKKQILTMSDKTPGHFDGQTSVLSQEEDHTSFLTRNATSWIKKQDRSRPFFLNVGYVAPHPPFVSDPIWTDYYKDAKIPFGHPDYPEVPNEIWGKMLEYQHGASFPHNWIPENLINSARRYYGRISLVDQGIGDIIKTVEEQGIADNTWILYSSDHGEMLGDHKMMGKKLFYQPSVRVPGIIMDAPIEAIDLTATILDIASAKPLPKSSGQSLLPLLNGEKPKKSVAFSEIGPKINDTIFHFVNAATRRYRLTYEITTNTPCEFFDLQEDPDEIHNRINDPSFASIREHMINELILPHMTS